MLLFSKFVFIYYDAVVRSGGGGKMYRTARRKGTVEIGRRVLLFCSILLLRYI